MSARKKSEAKPNKPAKPSTYREWALWRMRVRRTPSGRQIVGAGSRAMHRPPKYLKLAPILNEDEYDWAENANVAARELTRMRDEGLITCTDGWWWVRGVKQPVVQGIPKPKSRYEPETPGEKLIRKSKRPKLRVVK